ncbi:hypothetical protein RJT34_13877 [Clitoria ternatea]|uniref:Uncharacterized protein n=1 Tax=Clitoria ternatea TaxID=43366 RepID=A0AAN9JST9_CLITE
MKALMQSPNQQEKDETKKCQHLREQKKIGNTDFPKPPFIMDAEAVLNLFDSYWFGHQNLKDQPSSLTSTTSSHEISDHQTKEELSEEPMLTRFQSNHSRSMSDQLSSMTYFKHDSSLSPDSVLFSPKLQTILSGKDVTDTEAQVQHIVLPKKNNTSKGREKRRQSKSLSDLEFEELKGFMDLGFVFSEEDKDSSLASIIPGLQRLGKSDEEDEDCGESSIQRPYLSEAWKVHEKKKRENPLMNWKIPAPNNEIDMKDSLRCWAHIVASTVR